MSTMHRMHRDALIEHVRAAIEGLRAIPEPSDRATVIQEAGERFAGRATTANDLFDLADEFKTLRLEFLRRGAMALNRENAAALHKESKDDT